LKFENCSLAETDRVYAEELLWEIRRDTRPTGFCHCPASHTTATTRHLGQDCASRILRRALDHAGINRLPCSRDCLEVKLIAGNFNKHEGAVLVVPGCGKVRLGQVAIAQLS